MGKDLNVYSAEDNKVSVELNKNKDEEPVQKKVKPKLLGDLSTNVSGIMQVDQIMKSLQAAEPETRLEAVKKCSRWSRFDTVFIDEIIAAGILPILVQCLSCKDSHDVQYYAALTFTHITSGSTEHTTAVVNAGAVPALVELLMCHEDVNTQALQALGNIVSESPVLRDSVIGHGIMKPLLSLLNPMSSRSCVYFSKTLLEDVAWVIANLCRSKVKPPPVEAIRELLQALNILITHSDIDEVLKDTAWAISYLTNIDNSVIQEVIDSGIVPKLIRLFSHGDSRVQSGAVRAVGNIATGTDEQTQFLLNCGILSHISDLLSRPSEAAHKLTFQVEVFPSCLEFKSASRQAIRKDVMWTLSNIAAGNRCQLQALLESGLLPRVAEELRSTHQPTQREAAWIVSNFGVGGSKDQVAALVGSGVLPPFCDLLRSEDATLLKIVLEGLGELLKKAGADVRRLALAIEECGGLDRLEAVQRHEDDEIYEKAYNIIELYFEGQDEDVPQ